jgi:hypothetical protein
MGAVAAQGEAQAGGSCKVSPHREQRLEASQRLQQNALQLGPREQLQASVKTGQFSVGTFKERRGNDRAMLALSRNCNRTRDEAKLTGVLRGARGAVQRPRGVHIGAGGEQARPQHSTVRGRGADGRIPMRKFEPAPSTMILLLSSTLLCA